MKIVYMGHSSFKIFNNGKVIYIDPFVGDYSEPADLVLITHEHYDHNKIELVNLKRNTIVYRNNDFLTNGQYLTKQFDDLQITGVPAYNKNHNVNECVGFLIKYNDKYLYFGGDTSTTTYMNKLSQLNIVYTFLPIDGVFNMDAEEAGRCAELINSKYSVPIHTYVGKIYDEEIANKFNPKNKKIILPNNVIEL